MIARSHEVAQRRITRPSVQNPVAALHEAERIGDRILQLQAGGGAAAAEKRQPVAEQNRHGGQGQSVEQAMAQEAADQMGIVHVAVMKDRKSTRLNSSHVRISYAVFCLKKKKKKKIKKDTITKYR